MCGFLNMYTIPLLSIVSSPKFKRACEPNLSEVTVRCFLFNWLITKKWEFMLQGFHICIPETLVKKTPISGDELLEFLLYFHL